VPESLSPLERLDLEAWVAVHRDPAIRACARRLRDLEEACLDHHRARGNAARIVDWPAAMRTWIRIEASGSLSRSGKPPQLSVYPQPPPASEVFRRQREEEERRMREN